MSAIVEVIAAAWAVVCEMAPYLLLGFGISGLLYVFISPAWVERHLGGRGFLPVVKGALFGVPLPLCSCGVIPVTASIRAHGASRGATLSFAISTPQIGVDSIFATYALLGPVFGVVRPLLALVSGIAGGLIASLVDPDRAESAAPEAGAEDAACAEGDGCGAGVTPAQASLAARVGSAARYGFVTLPRDIGKLLVFGILVAALLSAFVEEGFLSAYLGGGLGAMLVMVLVGLPLYVCATAAIPLALGFMHLGASPGAALVFLVAGPAANAATISVIWKVLGGRAVIVHFMTILVACVGAGLLFDAAYAASAWPMPSMQGHAHHGAGLSLFSQIAGAALIAVLAWSFVSKRFDRKGPAASVEDGMETVELRVEGMTCSHCVATVTRALREVAGVRDAVVELDAKRATVTGEGIRTETLVEKIEGLGYSASAV